MIRRTPCQRSISPATAKIAKTAKKHQPAYRPWVIAVLLVFFCSTTVIAQSFNTNPAINTFGQDDFLPVDDAFMLQAWREQDGVKLIWQIANGYYLYKHRLTIEPADTQGVAIEITQIPEGTHHEDEYFGKVEVYYQELALLLAEEQVASALEHGILIGYQGCAEAGLCYPPQKRYLRSIDGQLHISNNID